MPRVLPFRGLRYDPAAAPDLAQLVSPPYDVINPEEHAQLQARSPHNAVLLELPPDDAGQPGSRYRAAAHRLADWQSRGVVHADPRPAYYLSETEFVYSGRAYRRRDLLAQLAVEPWDSGQVLPHEHTMAGPKVDRLDLLRATRLNASSIWVLHRTRLAALERAWAAAEQQPPAVHFSWRDEQHRLWLVDAPEDVAAIQHEFEAGGPLYIADGHHRYETSLAYRAEVDGQVPGAEFILAAVTWADDPGLLALPTHRLLHDLSPEVTLDAALARWRDSFAVTFANVPSNADPETLLDALASVGRTLPAFGLLGLGQPDRFATLTLGGGHAPEGALPPDRSAAWKSLDVSLLHTLLVDPLVAATGRPREEVLTYTRDPHQAFDAVRAGSASAAFFLNATPVERVLAVADAGDRMPEKSTYFYPKPPAGLVMRDLTT